MNPKIYKKACLYALGLGLVFTGCKTMQPLERERSKPVTLPTSFAGSNDTASLANLSWNKLFSDPYLLNLIDTALKQNWDLLSTVQRVEIARANFYQAQGTLKPSVQGIAAIGVDRFGDYTLNGVGNFDTNLSGNIDKKQKIPTPLTPDYFLGLRSSWEIDVWGKLRNRKSAAYYRLLSSEKGVQFATTLLVAEVANRYFELLAMDNELAIVRKNIQLQQDAVEIIQVQKQAGRATELAVQQFKAQLLSTQSLETKVLQRITSTENELNFLLGRLPQPITRGKSILEHQVPAVVQTGLPSAMLLRRPDIQQAELELRAAEADVAAARAAFLPSLTLTPYMGLNAFSAATLFNPASLAFGAVSSLATPLFNRSQLKGEYNKNLAATQEAYYNYQKAAVQGYKEVVTGLNKVGNLQTVFSLKEKEANLLVDAVSTSNDLYLAGYANYLEVVTAQKNALEAELELVDTKKDIFLSVIDIYRSLGGGWK